MSSDYLALVSSLPQAFPVAESIQVWNVHALRVHIYSSSNLFRDVFELLKSPSRNINIKLKAEFKETQYILGAIKWEFFVEVLGVSIFSWLTGPAYTYLCNKLTLLSCFLVFHDAHWESAMVRAHGQKFWANISIRERFPESSDWCDSTLSADSRRRNVCDQLVSPVFLNKRTLLFK